MATEVVGIVMQQTRDALREQLRQDAEVTRAQTEAAVAQAQLRAERAAQAAADAAARVALQGGPGAQVQVTPLPGGGVRINRNGEVTEIGPRGEVIATDVQAQTVPPVPPLPPGIIPIEAVVIAIAFFVMIVLVAIGHPFARAMARRMERKPAELEGSEIRARLDRIEQAIETVAVEVERISEGQRFTARLMSEMQQRELERIPARAVDGDAARGR